ncbi:MAG: hypothetical protein CMH28_03485 [Micavibrio sp.]|nr:hypothetical protein [Micavibrio sp.]|tara:strand:- start:313 stop:1320 length:1008 start_codon:yes stop_codon:yes gene_type:complete
MSVTLTRARYIKDGQYDPTPVRLPGSAWEAHTVPYDPQIHKDHLHCMSCSASLYYHSGSVFRGGSSSLRGASEHFSLKPGQRHSITCKMPNPEDDGDRTEYDQSRGFRFHLNIPDARNAFNKGAAYAVEKGGKLNPRQAILHLNETGDSFRSLTPKSMESVQDFIDAMQKEDRGRLNDSYVIVGHRVMRFKDFIIRLGFPRHGYENSRFGRLQEKLASHRGQKTYHGEPRIVEIHVDKPKEADFFEDKFSVKGRAIFLSKRGRDEKKFILPYIHVDSLYDGALQNLFSKAGTYSVMGMVRETKLDNGSIAWNMSVNDSRQVSTHAPSDIFKARWG